MKTQMRVQWYPDNRINVEDTQGIDRKTPTFLCELRRFEKISINKFKLNTEDVEEFFRRYEY